MTAGRVEIKTYVMTGPKSHTSFMRSHCLKINTAVRAKAGAMTEVTATRKLRLTMHSPH